MRLEELFGDFDTITALDIEELGLRLLPWIAKIRQREIAIAVDELRNSFQGRGYRDAETAVREAWAWLEGQALLIEDSAYISPNPMRRLSRKAVALVNASNGVTLKAANRIKKDELNPIIRDDVWSLYHRGKYDTAVFEAFKAVEVAVREASGLKSELGTNLMRRAFDKNNGPLTDLSMPEAEREARAHLFAGAIGTYKNPQSHRNVSLDDPDEAAEIIMLANHLLRIAGSRKI